MKKVVGTLLIILLLVIVAEVLQKDANNVDRRSYWVKTYGGPRDDVAFSVALSPSEDIIVGGYTDGFGAGEKDFLVLRLDKNGSVKWQKTYGGTWEDWAHAVTIANNGDVIVAGRSECFGSGGMNFWVIRLDREGNIKWQRSYEGPQWDDASAVAVAPNGDIIVVGYTSNDESSDWSFGVLRLNEDGSLIWAKSYDNSNLDEAHAVAVTNTGDIIVAGYTGADAWVLRLDANGNVKWQKTYGGSESDGVYGIALAPNGDIILVGWTMSFGPGSPNNSNVWVLRLDESGNIKWQKTYGGNGKDVAYGVVVATNGDIIVAGYTTSFGNGKTDAWILRLDKQGNIKWQKTYGGSDYDAATAVALTPEGDLIIAGGTTSFGIGSADVWILKLPPNGELSSCQFCQNSISQAEYTNAKMKSTNAKVNTLYLRVYKTNAEVQNAGIKVKTQWSYNNTVMS